MTLKRLPIISKAFLQMKHQILSRNCQMQAMFLLPALIFLKNFYISRNSQKTTFKVEDRVKQLRVNHVFKIFHEISPQYLNYSFVRVTDSQSYNTRGSDYNFRIPSINGCYTKTFYYNSILDWNNLPENIKSISNKETFKTAVKSYRLTAGQSEEARIFNLF